MRFPSLDLAITAARRLRFRTGQDHVCQAIQLVRGRYWIVLSLG